MDPLPLEAHAQEPHPPGSPTPPTTTTHTPRGFRPVFVEGRYNHDLELLVGPRGPPPGAISATGPNSGRSSGGMSSSPQGYFVVTPLIRKNNLGTILVNRGWVPRQYVQQNAPWDRPSGMVKLVGIPSQTENPTFLSPIHNSKKPKELLWFDRTEIEKKTLTTNTFPLLLVDTRTKQPEQDTTNGHDIVPQIPVKPSMETVGEFKVTPSTHVGYGLTWFGLSGAGIVMTRKLITRGRG